MQRSMGETGTSRDDLGQICMHIRRKVPSSRGVHATGRAQALYLMQEAGRIDFGEDNLDIVGRAAATSWVTFNKPRQPCTPW